MPWPVFGTERSVCISPRKKKGLPLNSRGNRSEGHPRLRFNCGHPDNLLNVLQRMIPCASLHIPSGKCSSSLLFLPTPHTEGTEEKPMLLRYLKNCADYINVGSLHKHFIFGDSRRLSLYVVEVGELEENRNTLCRNIGQAFFPGVRRKFALQIQGFPQDTC
jgi:hypothetical protein